jgi:transcriptional regulator with XRE-family HTH domain
MKEELLKFDTIGKRLIFLRGNKTQDVYAKLMGVSVPNYCKYEKDTVKPDWKKLKKIAEENDMTLNDITEGL